MSVQRLKWETNEKLQLKRLFRSHPLKPASYIRTLFNAGKPQHQRRSLNAVKYRVTSLKKEWYRRWLKERKGMVPTASASSTSSLFNEEYAWSAPHLGIFIPLHPLLKNDQLSPSNLNPEDGGLPAFGPGEEAIELAQEERHEEDEETFRRLMVHSHRASSHFLEAASAASMSLQSSSMPGEASCQLCRDRSTWNILHESYRRLEDSRNYGLQLERDLVEARNTLEQSRFALVQSQEALSMCSTRLDEERLEFRGTQEALNFEHERHKETTELLGRVFEEARLSGELADMRGRQLAMLQSIPGPQFEQPTAVAEEQWVASPLTKENLTQLQAWDEQSAVKDLTGISTDSIPGDFHGQQSGPPPQVDETEQGQSAAPKRPRSKKTAKTKPNRAPKKVTQKQCGRMEARELLPSNARGGGGVESIASAPALPLRLRPPEVNRLDHQIHQQNGSTSILGFSRHSLRQAKQKPTPSLSRRVYELTKELGGLRQEIQFYRECFEVLQRLRESAYDVYQQQFLAGHSSKRMTELISQLHHALEDSVRREVDAEKCWMESWGGHTEKGKKAGQLWI
ncbi:hypothetical protein V498_02412 [Pseudogymnoascus sp. VKM F-4517 (FW-2822)]|nr:hypothetical protein V498_02412 [Pseudogymnoascus sp. VKM F-4517 (FW-2822)]